MTVLLDIGSKLPLGPLWGTAMGFVGLMVGVTLAIGLGSRNLAVGVFGATLMFAHFAIKAEIGFLTNLFYVVYTLIIIATAFKIYRSEITGTGGV